MAYYSSKQTSRANQAGDGLSESIAKPRKVLHIIDHMGLGGAQAIVAKLITVQPPNPTLSIIHELVVLHGTGVHSEDIRAAGVSVRSLADSKCHLPAIILRLAVRLSRTDYDIVHLHLEASSLLGAVLAFLISRKPVIVTGYSLKEQYRWPRFHLFALIAPLVTSFVWLWHGNHDLQTVGVSDAKVKVIAIGIDVSGADPKRHEDVRSNLCKHYDIEPTRPLLLSVARLAVNRHIHLLIEAMRAIAAACPDAVLLMVGEGEERKRLEEIVRAYDIEQNVIFAGVRTDVWELYPGCDIYLSSSGRCDTGVAALQAMACERPVVTYTIAPMAQASCECRTQGHFIQARDPQTMAEMTISFLQSPERARAIGHSAREQILAHYSLEGMLQQYHELYINHMNSHKASFL